MSSVLEVLIRPSPLHTWLQTAPAQAGGARPMEPEKQHDLQKAERWSWDHRTRYHRLHLEMKTCLFFLTVFLQVSQTWSVRARSCSLPALYRLAFCHETGWAHQLYNHVLRPLATNWFESDCTTPASLSSAWSFSLFLSTTLLACRFDLCFSSCTCAMFCWPD